MSIQIRKAERFKSKLRLGIAGPSGAGKTMGALKLAKGLGGKILMIDTERGSGDLYAHLFDYDIITLTPPYAPKNYVEAIQAGEKAGYDVIIIDSLSHAWTDEGGLLDQVEKKGGSSYTAWKDITPQHRMLVNAMLNSPSHIIATMRSKQAYELEEYTDSKGNRKSRPVKMGMAPVQREGMEYEFTVMMDVNQEHNTSVTKDRTNMFKDEIFTLTEEVGQRLLGWLNEGIDKPDPKVQEAKRKIASLLPMLGYALPEKKEEIKSFVENKVKELTDLTLADENLPEIVQRLEVRVSEKKEAERQKQEDLANNM